MIRVWEKRAADVEISKKLVGPCHITLAMDRGAVAGNWVSVDRNGKQDRTIWAR